MPQALCDFCLSLTTLGDAKCSRNCSNCKGELTAGEHRIDWNNKEELARYARALEVIQADIPCR
jgi:hypothetical protein